MQAQDEHPARTDCAAPKVIRTEREFMDALRALRVRSGLSYRDIALRMAQVAPRHAMAKSTLAALFAQDALPRRPGRLTAIVDVLTAELTEPADVSARYLEAWTRLMTARSAQPGTPTEAQQASPPMLPTAAVAPPPVVPPPRHPAPLYSQPAYRKPSGPCTMPDQAKSDFEIAGGLRPLLFWGTVLSVITWLPLADGPVPFWAIWLAWCGPLLLCTAIAALFGPSRGSSSAELPAEYLHYEQRTTPRRPSLY
ncbi:hypothetical protein Pth03_01020 [Planotetraspora thailandica]|uniref:Helix-turn-helix protein n=1 Tax=Planotetraspora thailandica TaxID=487172 RepID=A0A8J3UUV8_9ACTN|nr:hypothetical protein [Planotetraspora thailandica]GII51713.1 hypothetical protein Pth03_01020 [Planotetraspora thailandica]